MTNEPQPYKSILGVALVDVDLTSERAREIAKSVNKTIDDVIAMRELMHSYEVVRQYLIKNPKFDRVYLLSEGFYTMASIKSPKPLQMPGEMFYAPKNVPEKKEELDNLIDKMLRDNLSIGILATDTKSKQVLKIGKTLQVTSFKEHKYILYRLDKNYEPGLGVSLVNIGDPSKIPGIDKVAEQMLRAIDESKKGRKK
jgi:hypothetical protein